MPRAIVVDLTSLSDSDDSTQENVAKDKGVPPHNGRPYASSKRMRLPSSQRHQRSSLPASGHTSTRALGASIEQNGLSPTLSRVSLPSHSEQPDLQQNTKDDYPRYLARWVGKAEVESNSLGRGWDEFKVDSKRRSWTQSKELQNYLPNGHSSNPADKLPRKYSSTKSDTRHSNLVDDLLLSDNDNDNAQAARESLGIPKISTAASSSKKQSVPYAALFTDPANPQSASRLTTEASSTASARFLKRKRVDDVKALRTTSQGARASPSGSRRQSTPVASQSETTGRRRGRPPGSQNKDKIPAIPSTSVPLHTRNASPVTGNRFSECDVLVHYPCSTKTLTRASILRHRELGGYPGFSQRSLQAKLRESFVDGQLSPWRWWEGASKDVITAAWAPDGLRFAVGASTDLDSLNLRYNRNNNLIWGDAERGSLTELADHHIARSGSAATDGDHEVANAYNTLDPRVFTTVSSICFNPCGDRMYTGSYDHEVKVWNTGEVEKPPTCVMSLEHKARVELLSECRDKSSHVLATAQSDSKHAISVFGFQSDDLESVGRKCNFTSERADRMGFIPTALRWGTIPSWTQHLLLSGFAANTDDRDRDRQGDLLLWDASHMAPFVRLSPAAQCVFDLAWHSRLALVAAATTPGPLLSSRSTKSVIRTWSPLESGSRIMELECPALDMNEVCFHPTDKNYVSAACTDGCAYVWDIRRPDDILQVLRHGNGIEEIDQDRAREEQDTGMRFISWSLDGTVLYTGSSDGVIKQWNPLVAAEDSLIRNVAAFDSGVMTGAFSPDHTNLLLGLCKGSVEMLSSAAPSGSGEVEAQFSFRPASTIHTLPANG